MRYIIVFALAIIFSPGLLAGDARGDAVADAKAYFMERLKDPDSAKFRNIVVYTKPSASGKTFYLVCGELNARNSYGGYTGFEPFYYHKGFEEMQPIAGIGTIRDCTR